MGFKVWGFRVSFGGFGLQGLGFQGFVSRVWSPRFRVSSVPPGFSVGSRGSSRGLGSKVWVSSGWFGLHGLWFAGLVWSV